MLFCKTLCDIQIMQKGSSLLDSNNNGMEEGEWMLSFNSQSFQLFNVFRSLSLFSFFFFFFVYQSFLSTYKDIIGKLSIHHIMFFAYGFSKRKWKPFLLLLSLYWEEKFSTPTAKNMKMKHRIHHTFTTFWVFKVLLQSDVSWYIRCICWQWDVRYAEGFWLSESWFTGHGVFYAFLFHIKSDRLWNAEMTI